MWRWVFSAAVVHLGSAWCAWEQYSQVQPGLWSRSCHQLSPVNYLLYISLTSPKRTIKKNFIFKEWLFYSSNTHNGTHHTLIHKHPANPNMVCFHNNFYIQRLHGDFKHESCFCPLLYPYWALYTSSMTGIYCVLWSVLKFLWMQELHLESDDIARPFCKPLSHST